MDIEKLLNILVNLPWWVRIIFVIAIMLITFFAGNYFFINPIEKNIIKIEKNISQEKIRVKGRIYKANKYEIYSKRNNELIKSFNELTKSYPVYKNILLVLDEISNIARSSGVVLQKITPSSKVIKNGHEEYTVVVILNSDYYNVLNFIETLGDLNNVMVINQTSIRQLPGKKNWIDVEISIKIYGVDKKRLQDEN